MASFLRRFALILLLLFVIFTACMRVVLGWTWADIVSMYALLVPSSQTYEEAVGVVRLYAPKDDVNVELIRSNVRRIAQKNGFKLSASNSDDDISVGIDWYEKGQYVSLRLERRRVVAVILSKLQRDRTDYTKITAELNDTLRPLGMGTEYPGPKE